MIRLKSLLLILLLIYMKSKGPFNNYVAKMSGGRGSKNVCFCPRSGYQEMAIFCPWRSCWMLPNWISWWKDKSKIRLEFPFENYFVYLFRRFLNTPNILLYFLKLFPIFVGFLDNFDYLGIRTIFIIAQVVCWHHFLPKHRWMEVSFNAGM